VLNIDKTLDRGDLVHIGEEDMLYLFEEENEKNLKEGESFYCTQSSKSFVELGGGCC